MNKPTKKELKDRGIEIHPTAVIYWDNIIWIGSNVKIGALCIVGAPPEDKKFIGKEHRGVHICDDVTLTGLVTIDAGTIIDTIIGHGSFLMKHSHVGHDVVIYADCVISCGVKIGGHCFIGHDTNIGLNAVIHQKVKVPSNCMIGMGAVVTKKTELKKGCKYVGNPARFLSYNIR